MIIWDTNIMGTSVRITIEGNGIETIYSSLDMGSSSVVAVRSDNGLLIIGFSDGAIMYTNRPCEIIIEPL